MDQGKKSLFQRIRNAKQSLENAEKSFQDDKGMRGELDLMLAEAELKNLRNKQDVPWSWNRHLLAMSMAVLLVIAGLGGWFFAKGNEPVAELVPISNGETPVQVAPQPEKVAGAAVKEPQTTQNNVTSVSAPGTEQKINSVPQETPAPAPSKVQLSEQEKRQLVRSAKSELSSRK